MDIINRIWMAEGRKRMRRDEGGWVDRGLPGATRAPAWETDRKLRLILGQKPLFACHGINKEKRFYFFQNRSIVLQRAVMLYSILVSDPRSNQVSSAPPNTCRDKFHPNQSSIFWAQ